MRCLYCGKHLPLFRKLTSGGEFCSDAHRDKYHEEYNKLAVSRLLQAQSRPEETKRGKKKGAPPPEPPPESPVEPEVREVKVRPTVEVELEVAALPNAPDFAEVTDLPETLELPKAPHPPEKRTRRQEPDIEVIAYVQEFQHQEVWPTPATLEWKPIDLEPVIPRDAPALPSLPETAGPRLEAGGLQSHHEAGFLTTRPQPQRGNSAVIETASPLEIEAAHTLPVPLDFEIGKTGLSEANPITRDALPVGYPNKFEPLALGVAAVEFTSPTAVVGTSSSTPVTSDFSKAGLLGLTLASQPPDEGTLEIETIARFRYLIELTPAFEAGLSLLDRDADEGSESPSVETIKAPSAVNGNGTEKTEPLDVTPRRVLEVLSRLQGDSGQPENGDPQPIAASSPSAEPPPLRSALKPLTITTLAPGPAALLAGYPTVPLGTKPVVLFYCPLPLRPKMAVGNASGPVARIRGAGTATGRKGQTDSPKNMPRSMLHLEQGSAGTDSEAETPTLFGKLGGLFGKRHKNH
jgi:hypothetical protein